MSVNVTKCQHLSGETPNMEKRSHRKRRPLIGTQSPMMAPEISQNLPLPTIAILQIDLTPGPAILSEFRGSS